MVIPATIISSFIGAVTVLFSSGNSGSDVLFTLCSSVLFLQASCALVRFLQSIRCTDLAGLVLVHIVYGIPVTTLSSQFSPASMNYRAACVTARVIRVFLSIMCRWRSPLLWSSHFPVTNIWNDFLFASHRQIRPHSGYIALNNLSARSRWTGMWSWRRGRGRPATASFTSSWAVLRARLLPARSKVESLMDSTPT